MWNCTRSLPSPSSTAPRRRKTSWSALPPSTYRRWPSRIAVVSMAPPRLYKAAKAAGLRALVGAEVSLYTEGGR